MADEFAFDPTDWKDFATIEEAMEAVTSDMVEPWSWNKWQKAMSALLPYYPDASRDTKKWSALRKLLMHARFGEGWARSLVALALMQTIPEEGPVEESGLPQLPDLPQGVVHAETSSSGGAGGAGSSAPGAAVPADGEAQLRAAVANGQVAEELLGQSAAQVFEQFPSRDSETSSAHDLRVSDMCDRMADEGISQEAAVQTANVELYMRQTVQRFAATDPEDSSEDAFKSWATKQFLDAKYLDAPTHVESEAYLLALARLANMKNDFIRRSIKGLQVYYQARARETSPPSGARGAGSSAPGARGSPEHHSMATPRAAAPTSPPQGQEALRSTHGTEFTPTEQGRSAGGGSGGSDNRVNDLLIAFRDMQREMVDGQTRLVEHLTTQPSSGTGGSGEERVNDKLNALTGIEFKQTLPVIRDADPDFDKHWRHVQSILDCHAFGRQGVRPLDVLILMKKTLAPSSSRLRTYQTLMDRARKKARLPAEAAKVLEEIKARLNSMIRETSFQREDRLDKEFERLEMGRSTTHVEFRSLFEEKLEELEDAEMGLASDKETLKRKYLSKLQPDLRRAVLGQLWPLDGEEHQTRRPRTWEEVAEAVEMELEHRVDTNAPTDAVNALGGSHVLPGQGCGDGSDVQGSSKCSHCQRPGHLKEMCPLKAAEVRGDVARLVADSTRTGRKCTVCGFGDHREEHHRLACADANYAVADGRLSWKGSKGGIQDRPPGGGGGGSILPADQTCRWCGKKGSEHPLTDQKSRGGHPLPKWCTDPALAGGRARGGGGRGGAGEGRGGGRGGGGAGGVPPPPIANYPREAPPNLTRSQLFDWARQQRKCFQCWKSLDDKAAHPEGAPCKRPDNASAGQENSRGGRARGGGRGGRGVGGGRGGPARQGEHGFVMKEKCSATGEDKPFFDILSLVSSPDGTDFDYPTAWLSTKVMGQQSVSENPKASKAVTKAAKGADIDTLFQMAESSSAIEVKRMDSLPADWYESLKQARPAGYAAQTRLFFGGLLVPALLDYGATVSAIPEEVACVIIQDTLDKLEAGTLTMDSPLYPISRLESYEEQWDLSGVAKDVKKKLTIAHGIVLRAEFVPINGVTGFNEPNADHPTKDIYFKILPSGTCGMEGVLLGYPTLDVAPYGLDHHREETSHVFRALNVALPRGELNRRTECRGLWGEYFASKKGEVANSLKESLNFFMEDSCKKIFESSAALARLPCAVVDVDDFSLAPGEQAMVPCRWDKPVPAHDFGCASLSMLDSKVEALPGVCLGGQADIMLCVENTTGLDAVLTRGDVVATAGPVPEGAFYARKGSSDGIVGTPEGSVENVDLRADCVDRGAAGAGSSVGGAEAARAREKITVVEELLPTPLMQGEGDSLSHLVQDDDLILKIHSQELPPDEYYDALGAVLAERFKGATPKLLEHVVALVAAFDTATSFALSFGIAKFQLCQTKVKLVGEYVGREGRSPNPDLVSAIKAWPSINNLKDLQSFLGTANYARPHMGPAYARICHPLRVLLTPAGTFPLNAEQLDAIEKLKGLILETHLLAVPDEEAAIEAATAFVAGEPPRGRPYELGADTSKIAAGGVLGQCSENNGALLVLMYWSAPLSVGQSQWHPFEQEFWGLWTFRRETVKHFGRIPVIIHTDHGTLTRLEYMALPRIDPKHFRWHAELTSGGSRFVYRAGTSAAHKMPDALSRNPPVRDELILARTGEWEQHRGVIRGIEKEFREGAFDEDDPKPPLTWDEALAQTGHKRGDVGIESAVGAGSSVDGAADSARQISDLLLRLHEGVSVKADLRSRLLSDEWLCGADVRPVEVLFLAPFAVTYVVDQQMSIWRKGLASWLAPEAGGNVLQLRVLACERPYDTETAVDGKGFWANPVHRFESERKKLLRKQLFASVVQALAGVIRQQARVLLGCGQGAVVAALMGLPLVVEAACRARIVADRELGDIRRAWAGVEWIVCVDPLVLPQRSNIDELLDAIPEVSQLQPRGILRSVVVTPRFESTHGRFAKELAAALGCPSVGEKDPLIMRAGRVAYESLQVEPPVYIEDDVNGFGLCAVCGKRSALGRCATCGLLMHFRCVPPPAPGLPQECPRCARAPAEADVQGNDKSWSYGQLKAGRFEKGALAPAPVGLSRGLDPRPACDPLVRPTDAEAVKAGFKDAQEWYAHSAGGALISAPALQYNMNSLPEQTSIEASEDSEVVQQWRLLRGDVAQPRAGGELLDSGRSAGNMGARKDAEALPTPASQDRSASGAGSSAAGAEVPAPARRRLNRKTAPSDQFDTTAVVADRMNFPHPYLLIDVESGYRLPEFVCDLRDSLSDACAELWTKDVTPGTTVIDIPVIDGVPDVRGALAAAQLKDPVALPLIQQLQHSMDPEASRKRRTGVPRQAGPLRPCSEPEEGTWRLAPVDGVLERFVVFSVAALWLPWLPATSSPAAVDGHPVSWRRWVFLHAHESFLNPHRTSAETFQVTRRIGYWATLAADVNQWCLNCAVCRRFRGHSVLPPMRSMLADDQLATSLPWTDVIIDVQGPFTRAETGEQYILSYHCVHLRVPILEPFKALQAGYFSRALVACVMRSRCVPDIVRSDRGPEMTSAVNSEFLAILNVKHLMGAALTPRHQGLGERGHQVMLAQHSVLMHAVCHAFPQEWPALVPAVEYLYHTAPQGAHGLSAYDMSCGFAIATPQEPRLAPFLVPTGLPETDVAVKLFSNFREVYGMFHRVKAEESLRNQMRVNSSRHERTFAPGETVFRRLPVGARLPKHLFPEPSSGPYEVVSQPTASSVVLKEQASGTLVESGARIPLDQILAGPARAAVALDGESDVRGIGQMLRDEDPYAGRGPARAGAAAGVRKGWGPLAPGAYVAYQTVNGGLGARDLTVGKVLVNHRGDRRLTVQPHRGTWKQVRVVHLPQFQTREGYADEGTDMAKETVRYEALVAQVELLQGGELTQSSSRLLEKRGWGLLVNEREQDQAAMMSQGGATGAGSSVGGAGPSISLAGTALLPQVVTGLGNGLERAALIAAGRQVELDRSALGALAYGHRVAFIELFGGEMRLTLGVRAYGLCVPDGIGDKHPLAGRAWDLASRDDQLRVQMLLDYLDPVVIHASPPGSKLSCCAARRGQRSFSEAGWQRAAALAEFCVEQISWRAEHGAAGSIESPKASRVWKLPKVVGFFGKRDHPKPARYFADPDLCQYEMKEPGSDDLFWRKSIVIAATYPEVEELTLHCEKVEGKPLHQHVQIKGAVHVPDGPPADRAKLSREYPLPLAVAWGRSIAKACFRVCSLTAAEWAAHEYEIAVSELHHVRTLACEAKSERLERGFAIWEPATNTATSLTGETESLFELAELFQDDGAEGALTNVFTQAAFKGAAGVDSSAGGAVDTAVKHIRGELPSKPERADKARAGRSGAGSWADLSSKGPLTPGQRKWMDRLKAGDLGGLDVDPGQYLDLRDQKVEGNPRAAEDYKQRCVVAVGLGPEPLIKGGDLSTAARYPHITNPQDLELMRWAVRRGSGCMWLPESPRTCVRGFRHQLITRGPPVRVNMHRLSKPDTEWIEQAIREDVQRGQLVKGVSDWGFPAFPTKESPDHKAVKRKRRMVVDYRALNRVTVRKVFLIPNSDYIKSCVSGSEYISVGDLKEGFNQVDNTPETAAKMAVLCATGCYLPRGLTFGPTNGPEDFQDLVFNVFSRRLYREWYLFLDDLSIATGRRNARKPGPSGAADVWG